MPEDNGEVAIGVVGGEEVEGLAVVHCVRVPLTSTTMAAFTTYGSVVGIVL